MTLDPAGAPANGDLSYSYRPTVLGAPWTFTLTAGGLDWSAGHRTGRVRYRDVRRVRLSFKPASMQPHRFQTEIWAEGAPKLSIMSASWKSIVEQERLDAPYAAFVSALHARLAHAAAPVRYEQGVSQFTYWPGLVLYAAVAFGLAGVLVRALQTHELGATAFIGIFAGVFLWQGGNFFRRNRPGSYRPEALPRALMPRA